MSSGFRIACLQINSGNDYQTNLATVGAMAREAAGAGAQFVLAPEYMLMMDGSGRVMRERAFAPDGAPALGELQALAHELKVWFLAGSLTLRTDDERIANRSFLISAEGQVVASYDKIHMFDVTMPDGRVIRESSAYRWAHAGRRSVGRDSGRGRRSAGDYLCRHRSGARGEGKRHDSVARTRPPVSATTGGLMSVWVKERRRFEHLHIRLGYSRLRAALRRCVRR